MLPPPLSPRRAAPGPLPLASALRRAFASGYGAADLRADLLAGAVVGIVALPLSMALAIAVGVPPQHGLYTAVFAGGLAALLGGSRFQVTGPTAAFVVILAPILQEHGLAGLLTAGFLAGLMLVALGAARLGGLIRFIPHPVITGFTTGIAAVIATLQLKDALGLEVAAMPEPYPEKVLALWHARGTASAAELGVALATLALLLGIPRVVRRIPAPLLALGAVAAGAALLHWWFPGFEVETIASRFRTEVGGVEVAGIPAVLPAPAAPWGALDLSFEQIKALLPAAFAIAMLGAIETLLSAVIADGMTGTRHDPDAELIALGASNIVAPFFGGIAATGALARTATNIRFGARSPIAAMTHAGVVLLGIVLLAPLVGYIPMASLAALLLLVAWNMSEARQFLGLIRTGTKSDVLVLVVCFLLTVLFNMVWAVGVGFVLAAVLFLRRMAEITESSLLLEGGDEGDAPPSLPAGVAIYEVSGPLFFGAAQKAMDTLHAANADLFHTLVLHLGRVPVIDATGLATLESTLRTLQKRGKRVVLAGPLPRPHHLWTRADLGGRFEHLRFASDLSAAIRHISDSEPVNELEPVNGSPPGADRRSA